MLAFSLFVGNNLFLILNILTFAKSIVINKCCKMDQMLNNKKQCELGDSSLWAPLIFMIDKVGIFDRKGEFPENFKILENKFPQCETELSLSQNIVIFSNGILFLNEERKTVSPDNYCADKHFILSCTNKNNNEPKKQRLIKKCCGPDAVYNLVNNSCNVIHNLRTSLFYFNTTNMNVKYSFGFPECKSHIGIVSEWKTEDIIRDQTKELENNLNSKNICFDYTISDNFINKSTLKEFRCLEKHEKSKIENEGLRFKLSSVGLFISSFFLLASIIIAIFFMPSYHLLHWKCQINYIVCLMVGDLLLGTSQLYKMHGILCILIAVLMHFSFLSAFFWLNSMCINIWWTFRDFRPTSIERVQEILRWRFFQIYAWGLPIIIVVVGISLDNININEKSCIARPHFFDGENCWFQDDSGKVVFFYCPIGILLCVNFLLFSFTAKQLTCGIWKSEDNKSFTEKTALGKICIKLVVIMGITWIADLVSWIFKEPIYFWYFFDIINTLQGIFIFFVVGCQRQILRLVKWLYSLRLKPRTHFVRASPVNLFLELPSAVDSTFTDTKSPFETSC